MIDKRVHPVCFCFPLETYHIFLSSITLYYTSRYYMRLWYKPPALPLFIKYFLNIPFMVVYSCKKCGEPNFLTPHAFWDITDFGAKCERCETINTITLEKGELKKQV
jgi:hypothetical protein